MVVTHSVRLPHQGLDYWRSDCVALMFTVAIMPESLLPTHHFLYKHFFGFIGFWAELDHTPGVPLKHLGGHCKWTLYGSALLDLWPCCSGL
jgi:hypothetical protein